jgi:putative transposase
MYKTFEYRLFTNRYQNKRLLSCLTESRHLYNEMLEMLKAYYEETGKFIGHYDLTYHFKGRGGQHVPQTTVQTLADRLHKALKRFLSRKELDRKVGFPRFKSANRWHSIQLRQYGRGRDVFLDSETKRLHVPSKLGSRLKVRQHRPLEGIPKTAHLVYRADGHWYVLIVCDIGEAPPKREGDAIGLDLGRESALLQESPKATAAGATQGRKAKERLQSPPQSVQAGGQTAPQDRPAA